MQNIEIKISITEKNKRDILKKLKLLPVQHRGVLRQADTYYNCLNGRLKIREINGKKYELIFYQRPDKKQSRMSNYKVINLTSRTCKEMKLLLRQAFGIMIQVKKNRDLWLYNTTRIHLDKVEKLGSYLELETVMRGQSRSEARQEHQEVINKLNLSKYRKLSKSYSDMLMKK